MQTFLDGSLSANELNVLRENKLIESNEIVFRYGDLYVAENVITRQRRQLHDVSSFLNEGRRVLNG